jgi:acyl carrier protein phosphodiesterase
VNWLAHLVLSDSQPAFRVGNVLADILPIGELRELPEPFQAGIARHRAIDSFTDRHAAFRRSVARLQPPFRRYGGVIIDIVYDHLLTVNWRLHGGTDLHEFVAQFHNDVELCRADIPANAYQLLEHMRAGEWLTSYGDLDGVRVTLSRMSRRLRRPFDLGAATDEVRREYAAIGQDFSEFFPQIRARFPHG